MMGAAAIGGLIGPPGAVVAGNCGADAIVPVATAVFAASVAATDALADVTMLTVCSQPDAVITADAVIFPTWMLGEMESSATMPTGALTGPLSIIPDALVVPFRCWVAH